MNNYERKRYLKNMPTEDESQVVQDILSAVVTEVKPEVLRVSVPISVVCSSSDEGCCCVTHLKSGTDVMYYAS